MSPRPDLSTPEPAGTRRRGAELRQAIFDAVHEQLRTVGYTALTMEGVAAAARTGKAALYRRWSSKNDLVLDALADALPSPAPIDQGTDLRAGLSAALNGLRDALNGMHATVFQVVADEAGHSSPLVRTLLNARVLGPCQTRIQELLRDAVEVDQAPADLDAELIAALGPALLHHHCLTQGTLIPADLVTSTVDAVLLPLIRRATA
ncbi:MULTISPECIES: TetR-like C-terminal domain-containing protein [Streptomyces]|uniref:TetR-like C-terminal domain-containing protein n=2 Tax=Streptomyces TaxID=1883 RepID=A0ABU4KHY1_9ACTN|nr:TetR-like C-terminal domain-containing protein [Streptomyces roseolus]MDX2297420.1 TetR-like C-terminal domain-containing protein [Streptomyces roseolus]